MMATSPPVLKPAFSKLPFPSTVEEETLDGAQTQALYAWAIWFDALANSIGPLPTEKWNLAVLGKIVTLPHNVVDVQRLGFQLGADEELFKSFLTSSIAGMDEEETRFLYARAVALHLMKNIDKYVADPEIAKNVHQAKKMFSDAGRCGEAIDALTAAILMPHNEFKYLYHDEGIKFYDHDAYRYYEGLSKAGKMIGSHVLPGSSGEHLLQLRCQIVFYPREKFGPYFAVPKFDYDQLG